MFKRKLQQQEQGFTLVEVLVAIIITVMFTAIAMQMMVFAAVFRTRAEELTKVTTWIQEDLENVKYDAGRLKYTSLSDENNGDGNSTWHENIDNELYVASVYGFENGDTLIVGTDDNSNRIDSFNDAANTISLDTQLNSDQSKGVAVIGIPSTRCNPPFGNPNAGFAKHLQDKLSPLSVSNTNVETRRILGKNYTLTRTSNIKNIHPYAVLELTYSVTSPSAVSPVANFYTEVIPNAALRCAP